MKLELKHDLAGIYLHDKTSDYMLCVGRDAEMGSVFFYSPMLKPNHPKLGLSRHPISGRDLDKYPFALENDRNIQYIDVGGGLAESTVYMATTMQLKTRPIIIDMADYQKMAEMLAYTLEQHDFGQDIRERIIELQRRIGVILNPELVRLVNMPLSQAVNHVRELGDVVIDYCGPWIYP